MTETSFPFTDAELLDMMLRERPTESWQKAFNIYNADISNKRLSMGCAPCFMKVMKYLLIIRFSQQ